MKEFLGSLEVYLKEKHQLKLVYYTGGEVPKGSRFDAYVGVCSLNANFTGLAFGIYDKEDFEEQVYEVVRHYYKSKKLNNK